MTHPIHARQSITARQTRNRASYALNALIVMLGVVIVAGTLLGVRQLRERPGQDRLVTASESEAERD